MSVQKTAPRHTVPQLQARKGKDTLVCLTAYTAPMARLLDDVCDLLLVGDSLGMVLYGYESTLPVTMELMLPHVAAVVRASRRALVVADMPFGSYQESPAQAFHNAARFMAEAGAQAVKLEGGEEMAATLRFLTQRGIPVIGHIGLTPQSLNTLGGYKVQGKTKAAQARLSTDAQALTEAGAFALVLEALPPDLAQKITQDIPIPTIGIGAGAACDGQILVSEDMLGLLHDGDGTRPPPRFVKEYAPLGAQIRQAAQRYRDEVRAKQFPTEEHSYAKGISTEEPQNLRLVDKGKK